MATRTGTTAMTAKLRGGAGTEYPVLALLPSRTPLLVLDEDDEWYEVSTPEGAGFVPRPFIVLAEESIGEGFLKTTFMAGNGEPVVMSGERDLPFAGAVLMSAPLDLAFAPFAAASASLEPPGFLKIKLGPEATSRQQLVAKSWNRVGGFLAELAAELKVEPGVVVAVLAVEAGGRAFGPDGRMVIRFEAHIFYDYWGKNNPPLFHRHFRFNVNPRWKGHQWRRSENEAWRDFHDMGQSHEWEVFEFARMLSDKGAKLSISMGGPQIMGFNYPNIGYESVQQMFDAFSSGERAQIIGFFDFVKRSNPNSERILALRARDFDRFATLYNGASNGKVYAERMRVHFEAFQELWEPLSVRRVSVDELRLRRAPELHPENIIRELSQGTRVTLLVAEPVRAEGMVWVKVRVGQEVGFVSGAFLDPIVS